MKKIFMTFLMVLFTISIYSCRETEMNTDGNTEPSDSTIEEREEGVE